DVCSSDLSPCHSPFLCVRVAVCRCFSWFIGPAPYCSASQDEHVVFQAHRDRFPGTVAHRFTVLSWPLCTGALGAPTETHKGHITKSPTTSPDILRKYP